MLDNIKKEILLDAAGCYDSGWEKIFAAMQTLYSMNAKAHREGILILEDGLENLEDKTLQYFLYLIIDGTDAKVIEEYIENMYYTSLPRGLEGLLFLIDACGALYLQRGESELNFTYLFKSLVPASRNKEVFYDKGIERKKFEERIRKAVKQNTLEDVINFTPTEDSFSQEIASLPDVEFEILRKQMSLERIRWAPALKYSTSQLINRMIDDGDWRYVFYLVDSINEEHTKEESDKAKEEILAALTEIKHKTNMAAQGKATEAFGLDSISDDFSKTVESLSNEQIKVLIEKAKNDDLINALNYTTPEVMNKFAVNMDTLKLFSIFGFLGSRYSWHKKESDESKKKILALLDEIDKNKFFT